MFDIIDSLCKVQVNVREYRKENPGNLGYAMKVIPETRHVH